ncbi:MAG: DUF983 domain-containing protein [Erythrobacter sp.]
MDSPVDHAQYAATERGCDALRLPRSLAAAILRAVTGRCPRCGMGKLFDAFLKPVETCPQCSQDWSLHRADDFPPYIAMFISSFVGLPLAVALALSKALSTGLAMALVIAVSLPIAAGVLQPSKGAIIALQWWLGMHGFERERARPNRASS